MDIPKDKNYHLVAAEPYIENVNVMHHIIVYGCKDSGMLIKNSTSNYNHVYFSKQNIDVKVSKYM